MQTKKVTYRWYVVSGIMGVITAAVLWNSVTTEPATNTSVRLSNTVAPVRDVMPSATTAPLDAPRVLDASVMSNPPGMLKKQRPEPATAASTTAGASETPDVGEATEPSALLAHADTPEGPKPSADQIVVYEEVKQNIAKANLDENFDLRAFMADPRLAAMHASQSSELIEKVMKGLENIRLKSDQKQQLAKTQ